MAYRPSEVRNQKQSSIQEPNIIPIMNLFLTIIPFLMLFIVLSKIALINIDLGSTGSTGGAGEGGEGGNGGKKELRLQVIIYRQGPSAKGKEFAFEIREQEKTTKTITPINGRYNYVQLDNALRELKARYPETFNIEVAPDHDVLYDDLLQAIDISKKNGFLKVNYGLINVEIGFYRVAIGGLDAA